MTRILFYAAGEAADLWLSEIQKQRPDAEVRLWQAGFDSSWQADYALVWKPPAELFEGQQRLKAVINLGAGVDHLLRLPNLPKVPLLKLRDAGMARWMLDYIRYGLLHFTRDFDHYRSQQTLKRWQPWGISPRAEWPVGILGAGPIGAQVAEQLADEGYSVHCWSRSHKTLAGVVSHAGLDELPTFLRATRILINLLPATAHTHHLIGADQLAQLQPDARLISVGRAEVINPAALLRSLDSGRLGGALLDVFETEPLPEPSPLWSHPAVLVTPHIAAPTPIDQAITQVVGYINANERGEPVKAVDLQRGY